MRRGTPVWVARPPWAACRRARRRPWWGTWKPAKAAAPAAAPAWIRRKEGRSPCCRRRHCPCGSCTKGSDNASRPAEVAAHRLPLRKASPRAPGLAWRCAWRPARAEAPEADRAWTRRTEGRSPCCHRRRCRCGSCRMRSGSASRPVAAVALRQPQQMAGHQAWRPAQAVAPRAARAWARRRADRIPCCRRRHCRSGFCTMGSDNANRPVVRPLGRRTCRDRGRPSSGSRSESPNPSRSTVASACHTCCTASCSRRLCSGGLCIAGSDNTSRRAAGRSYRCRTSGN
mmetsp:Transcript_118851/g.341269  ORF Transcript_118851/g.341269 Transcript_118851/m.341269 type:complete len:286 (-) Transcript_118851:167-1024(-)